MSDVFYGGFLKFYKCSNIPMLKSDDFTDHGEESIQNNYHNQLRVVLSQALMEIISSASNRRGLIPGSFQRRGTSLETLDWRNISSRTKIFFKQDNIRSEDKEYVVSYMMVKFSKEVSVKRQFFVFIQASDNATTGDGKTFQTLIILKNSFTRFSQVFLHWCKTYMGTSVSIHPLKLDSLFVKSTLNILLSQYCQCGNQEEKQSLINKLGDLSFEFKIKTSLGALNKIQIDITKHDLIQFLDQMDEKKNVLDLLFAHFQASTAIEFRHLPIAKATAASFVIVTPDKTGSKIQFHSGENGIVLSKRNTEGAHITIYDLLFQVYEMMNT